MFNDPIVEEIHRIREAYAASMNYDLAKMFADIQSREGRDGRTVIQPTPRKLAEHQQPLVALDASPPTASTQLPSK